MRTAASSRLGTRRRVPCEEKYRRVLDGVCFLQDGIVPEEELLCSANSSYRDLAFGAKMMVIEPGCTLSFASFFARTTSTPKMELGQCGLEAMMTKSRPGGM